MGKLLNNFGGKIQGLNYDIICNVMSSFKDEYQRKKKLRYPGNFPITHDDSVIENGNQEDGYIKAEQFYYFNKEELDYIIIGTMKKEAFEYLLDFIENLNVNLEHIIENL